MKKSILSLLACVSISFAEDNSQIPYWSEYIYAHRLGFEAEGYTLFGWNHHSRTLVKITNKKNNIVDLNYVVVESDKYVIEKMKFDCKKKLSISTDQYESINGGEEKHYIVEGGWEKISIDVGVGEFGGVETDLHYSLYKQVCRKK